METTAPFDLNKAIQSWREKLAGLSAFRSGDADELEAHLRDSITALQGNGLAAHEAFWVATNRLGTYESLAAEFGKINTGQVWIHRSLWMLAGAIALGLISSLSNGVATLAAAGAYTLTGVPVILGPVSLVLRLALPALLLLFIWRSGQHPDGWVWRMGRRLKATPKASAVVVFLVSFFALPISSVAQVVAVKMMAPQDYSLLFHWSWPSTLVFALLIPILLGWLLVRSSRKEMPE